MQYIKYEVIDLYKEEKKVRLMTKTKRLNPLKISLDKNNPRFALFDYDNEEEIINHLIKYENVKNLAEKILEHGYITLGERLIIVENKGEYTVLEGNRRIAALKILFNKKDLFEDKYHEKVKALDIKDFYVDCDIINEDERQSAEYKISAKHIEGIKQWTPTDKRVYYDKLFTEYKSKNFNNEDALENISKLTPESKAIIKNAIRKNRFIKLVYDETKKVHGKLKNISQLDSDVLTSRIKPRLVEDLSLKEDNNFYLKSSKGKEKIYNKILLKLGEAAWIDKTIDTRILNTKDKWNLIIDENKKIPGLKDLIIQYQSGNQGLNYPSDQFTNINSQDNSKNKNNTGAIDKKSQNNTIKKSEYNIKCVDETVYVDKLDYNLMENIYLSKENTSLSRNSPEYNKITFSSASDDFLIKGNKKIDSLTKNGNYKIKATYKKSILSLN